ncbi:MAG TPA: hypothetical protein VM100_11250 [Longimicrobiales bacterium]|nr:hypothetical protein [Longimicrobiales bacterium]
MNTHRILCSAVVLVLAACAPPMKLNTGSGESPSAKTVMRKGEPVYVIDDRPVEPAVTTVQVRYYPLSPDVKVIAWGIDDPHWGLKADIARDGSIIRDHRIFVETYYDTGIRAYKKALVGNRVLLMTGISRDDYNCFFRKKGERCSPTESFGARIPDELLRSATDSVDVVFQTSDRDLTFNIDRYLLKSYLAKVDSVQAELRKLRSLGKI